jgi:hypothetical protein
MYLIFKLSGVDYCSTLAVDIDVNFCLGFGTNVVLTVFVRIVRLVRAGLLFFKPLDLAVDIELVPCIVVVLDRCCIPHQVDFLLCLRLWLWLFLLLLLLLLLGILLFLFLDLLFKLFLDLLLFDALFL